jgi:hypothetical protein
MGGAAGQPRASKPHLPVRTVLHDQTFCHPQIYVISKSGRIVCDTHDIAEAAATVEAELRHR